MDQQHSDTDQQRSIGVITLIIKDRKAAAGEVNDELSRAGEIVVARMGMLYRERNIHIITLIVDATNDQIGALTGRLGQIEGITVKSTLAKL
jgi:putative iron-only hydrogenase system regulator